MIKVIALLKKKPGYSQEEFRRRWVEDHTRLSAQLPGLKGYRINIALPDQPEVLARPAARGPGQGSAGNRAE